MNIYAIAAIVGLGIAAVVGIVVYHEISIARAFDRGEAKGIADTTEHMRRAIEAQRKAAEENAGRWGNTPPAEIRAELLRRCILACAGNAACIKGCE